MNVANLVHDVGLKFNEDALFTVISSMLPIIFTAFTVGLSVYLLRRILRKMGKFKVGF